MTWEKLDENKPKCFYCRGTPTYKITGSHDNNIIFLCNNVVPEMMEELEAIKRDINKG